MTHRRCNPHRRAMGDSNLSKCRTTLFTLLALVPTTARGEPNPNQVVDPAPEAAPIAIDEPSPPATTQRAINPLLPNREDDSKSATIIYQVMTQNAASPDVISNLTSSGLMFGISGAVNFPATRFGQEEVSNPYATGLAHISIFPAYVIRGEEQSEQNLYCASKFGGAQSALEAAEALAHKRAQRFLEFSHVFEADPSSITDRDLREALGDVQYTRTRDSQQSPLPRYSDDDIATIRDYIEVYRTPPENRPPTFTLIRQRALVVVAMRQYDWQYGVAGKCWSRKFGLWAGVAVPAGGANSQIASVPSRRARSSWYLTAGATVALTSKIGFQLGVPFYDLSNSEAGAGVVVGLTLQGSITEAFGQRIKF